MLLSRRKAALGGLLLLPLAVMSACGFQPVYGPQGAAQGLRGKVQIAAPDTRLGYDLVAALEDRLGRTQSVPDMVLSYDITTKESSGGITSDQAITRYTLSGSVSYEVRDVPGVVVRAHGVVSGFTGYNSGGGRLSTLSAERDAGTRLMVQLAQQIEDRLVLMRVSEALP